MTLELKSAKTADILAFERPKTGGKEPPNNKEWLRDLNEGAVFVCKEKARMNPVCEEYHLIGIKDNAALLFMNIVQPAFHTWVEVDDFCNRYRLVTVVNEGRKNEQEQCNRPDQSRGLVHDERDETSSPLDEGTKPEEV